MAKIHRNDKPAGQNLRDTLPQAAPQPLQEPPADENPPPPKQVKKPARPKSGIGYTVAMLLCLGVFLFSGGMLLKRYWEDRQAENEFSDLQAMIQSPEASDQTADGTDNSAKFAALVEQNPDFVGWISIEGTNLDFPVMFSPSQPDYYLRHDFAGEYSVYGVPYLDEATALGPDRQSENLIVYGHNMKTGTIFGFLTDYKQPETYQEHPTIRLDTLYGAGEYEVFAAFAIDIAADRSFAYNNYIDLDEDSFREFVEEVKRRSDVDSGITPVYGDELLTLSTCEYSSANGRYVVCARRTGG